MTDAAMGQVTAPVQSLEHRSPPRADGDDIPDGGLIAWTQVVMGHLVIFNCWGYITSYVNTTLLPTPAQADGMFNIQHGKLRLLPTVLCGSP